MIRMSGQLQLEREMAINSFQTNFFRNVILVSEFHDMSNSPSEIPYKLKLRKIFGVIAV